MPKLAPSVRELVRRAMCPRCHRNRRCKRNRGEMCPPCLHRCDGLRMDQQVRKTERLGAVVGVGAEPQIHNQADRTIPQASPIDKTVGSAVAEHPQPPKRGNPGNEAVV